MLLVVTTEFFDKDEDMKLRKPFDFIEKVDEERINVLIDGGYCIAVPAIEEKEVAEEKEKAVKK